MQTIFDFFYLSFMTPLNILMLSFLVFVGIKMGVAVGIEWRDKKGLPMTEGDRTLMHIAGIVAGPMAGFSHYLRFGNIIDPVILLHIASQCALAAIVGVMAIFVGKALPR